jgi:hypothetical protein
VFTITVLSAFIQFHYIICTNVCCSVNICAVSYWGWGWGGIWTTTTEQYFRYEVRKWFILRNFVNDSLEGLIYKLQGVCEEVKSMMLRNIYRILEVIIFLTIWYEFHMTNMEVFGISVIRPTQSYQWKQITVKTCIKVYYSFQDLLRKYNASCRDMI